MYDSRLCANITHGSPNLCVSFSRWLHSLEQGLMQQSFIFSTLGSNTIKQIAYLSTKTQLHCWATQLNYGKLSATNADTELCANNRNVYANRNTTVDDVMPRMAHTATKRSQWTTKKGRKSASLRKKRPGKERNGKNWPLMMVGLCARWQMTRHDRNVCLPSFGQRWHACCLFSRYPNRFFPFSLSASGPLVDSSHSECNLVALTAPHPPTYGFPIGWLSVYVCIHSKSHPEYKESIFSIHNNNCCHTLQAALIPSMDMLSFFADAPLQWKNKKASARKKALIGSASLPAADKKKQARVSGWQIVGQHLRRRRESGSKWNRRKKFQVAQWAWRVPKRGLQD